MDFTYWKPHGFIRHPPQETLYLPARVTVNNEVVVDPKEYKTMELFLYMFNQKFFPGLDYIMNPRLQLTFNNEITCNEALQYLSKKFTLKVFCLIVGRRGSREQRLQIEHIEDQAMNDCRLVLEADQDLDQVFAVTLVGVSLRCWSYERGAEELIGLWDSDQRGGFQYYLDIGSDEHVPTIEAAMNDTKPAVVEKMWTGTSVESHDGSQ